MREPNVKQLEAPIEDIRNKELDKGWKYTGHSTVSNGRKTVYLTSGVRPDDAMRHVKGVLARQHAASDNHPEQ